jgi:hypothetical protein
MARFSSGESFFLESTPPGDRCRNPAAGAESRVFPVVQVHGDGPFDITYINPDDDPSKAAAKK